MHPKQQPFNGYEQGPDFDRARSQIATPFQYVDILLDVAASNQTYNISGDFLYIDASSTGTVTLELNNQYNDPSAPFQVSAGFGLNALFKQIKLSWAAQAGKKIRVMYSTGDKVVPTNSTSISGSVSVNQTGFSYTNSYKSLTAMAANTADPVFLAGANTAGAIVWTADFYSRNGVAAGGATGFLAKATAPATAIDGDVICSLTFGGSSAQYGGGKLAAPVKIAAGKGLYYIARDGDVAGECFRSVLYTLL